jgi:hypothetical protein
MIPRKAEESVNYGQWWATTVAPSLSGALRIVFPDLHTLHSGRQRRSFQRGMPCFTNNIRAKSLYSSKCYSKLSLVLAEHIYYNKRLILPSTRWLTFLALAMKIPPVMHKNQGTSPDFFGSDAKRPTATQKMGPRRTQSCARESINVVVLCLIGILNFSRNQGVAWKIRPPECLSSLKKSSQKTTLNTLLIFKNISMPTKGWSLRGG